MKCIRALSILGFLCWFFLTGSAKAVMPVTDRMQGMLQEMHIEESKNIADLQKVGRDQLKLLTETLGTEGPPAQPLGGDIILQELEDLKSTQGVWMPLEDRTQAPAFVWNQFLRGTRSMIQGRRETTDLQRQTALICYGKALKARRLAQAVEQNLPASITQIFQTNPSQSLRRVYQQHNKRQLDMLSLQMAMTQLRACQLELEAVRYMGRSLAQP